MRTTLTASSLFTGDTLVPNPLLAIEDGIVTSITSRDSQDLPTGQHRDFPDALLTPAYLDVHIHGVRNRDIMEGSADALRTIGSFLASRGVAQYLPTTISAPRDKILRSLDALSVRLGAAPQPGIAQPLGIHIEGPFLSHGKRGAHPSADLIPPSIPFFDAMYEASSGRILLMTIAPELPGAIELIAHAVARGVRVSIGHSEALSSHAEAAIAAGAASATHTFNAMRKLDQREPGILGTVLSSDQLHAEIICDGLHVDPAIVRLFARSKPADRAILVTDAMSATGMPDGNYKLGDLDVRVKEGRAIIEEDTLAGSTLTLDRAVSNYAAFARVPLTQAVRAVTANPASMLGIAPPHIAVGAPAHFNVLAADGTLLQSFLNGETATAPN